MHKQIYEEIKAQKNRSVLIILTGPTGAGKDTVLNHLLHRHPTITKIITTTSRPMREIESEGNPYHFITREEFEKMIGLHAFYEWVEFRSDLYGTQKKTIENALKSGHDVVWKIEAKGVKNIKQKIKENYPRSVLLFLTAPSIHMMYERIEKDSGNNLHHRWNEPLVKWEMEQYDDSEYLVVNEDGKLDETVKKIEAIIESKRQEIIEIQT